MSSSVGCPAIDAANTRVTAFGARKRPTWPGGQPCLLAWNRCSRGPTKRMPTGTPRLPGTVRSQGYATTSIEAGKNEGQIDELASPSATPSGVASTNPCSTRRRRRVCDSTSSRPRSRAQSASSRTSPGRRESAVIAEASVCSTTADASPSSPPTSSAMASHKAAKGTMVPTARSPSSVTVLNNASASRSDHQPWACNPLVRIETRITVHGRVRISTMASSTVSPARRCPVDGDRGRQPESVLSTEPSAALAYKSSATARGTVRSSSLPTVLGTGEGKVRKAANRPSHRRRCTASSLRRER